MPDATPLRIAVTGSAGVGKTTLATALAARLDLPLVPEEMREHLVAAGRPLSRCAPGEVRAILDGLWRTRRDRERALGAFVADNCALDFAAYALHHGALDELGDTRSPLLLEPAAHVRSYDAVLVLPFGAIPYQRDGVRPDSASSQLRYQLLLEALLQRETDPRRVHHLPPSCTRLEDRVAWAVSRLPPQPRPASAGGATGRVYLVGAGPGDPDLLTCRALALMQSADAVAHDELVPPAVLALAGPRVELVPVGRRHHGSSRHPLRLHPEVLTRARAGQVVVRLKAGDPFVFGRGGEEAEELAQAGVPFEVVPGVSAALGAAARALIPLTHREHASDVTFASGHDLLGCKGTRSDWSKLAGPGTLVLYMASRALAANMARLLEMGRAPATPAAWVADATRPEQQVVVGTVADLAERVAETQRGDAPALVVVGEVVALRARLVGGQA